MMRRLLAFAAVGSLVAPAAIAAPWIDDQGRFLLMQFPGAPIDELKAASHDVGAAASLFKSVCLDTGLDRAAAGKQAEAAGWGFAYRPTTVPFKKPVDLGGWITDDAALNVGSGLFFNKHSQCSLTVAVAGPADAASAEAAMSGLLGTQPSNAAKAIDGKGQRKKFYEPEWTLTDQANGAVTTVYVRSLAGTAGHVQFAALRKVKK